MPLATVWFDILFATLLKGPQVLSAHVGTLLFHVPLPRQRKACTPTTLYPVLQSNVIPDPTSKEGVFAMMPWSGGCKPGQDTAHTRENIPAENNDLVSSLFKYKQNEEAIMYASKLTENVF